MARCGMTRILLIDADVVAYRAASSVEVATEWEPGYWTWHADEYAAREAIDTQIDTFMRNLKGDEFKLCLTDSEGNFRKRIMPSYKGQRASVKKPLVLKAIREWMIETKGAYLKPHLEGDDVMGILATWKGLKGEKVIVSVDKDMKTIPGLFSKDGETIEEITEERADYWHLYQTLVGDQTDGYPGCPGIGPVKATAILDNPDKDNMPRTVAEMWCRVVDCFKAKGLSKEEALLQARVARILRSSDYDFAKKEPILWTPK